MKNLHISTGARYVGQYYCMTGTECRLILDITPEESIRGHMDMQRHAWAACRMNYA